MKEIRYDYSKLLGRLAERGLKQYDLAKELGITSYSVYKKLNSKSEFKQQEILHLINFLNIEPADISKFFFKEKV